MTSSEDPNSVQRHVQRQPAAKRRRFETSTAQSTATRVERRTVSSPPRSSPSLAPSPLKLTSPSSSPTPSPSDAQLVPGGCEDGSSADLPQRTQRQRENVHGAPGEPSSRRRHDNLSGVMDMPVLSRAATCSSVQRTAPTDPLSALGDDASRAMEASVEQSRSGDYTSNMSLHTDAPPLPTPSCLGPHQRLWFRQPSVVWYRGHDLRVEDHPAMLAAAQRGGPVVPLFIWDETYAQARNLGSGKRWWLRKSLKSLGDDLRELGVELILRRGESAAVLRAFLAEIGADAVFWNRCYEPDLLKRDEQLRDSLARDGLTAESFKAELLVEPWELSEPGPAAEAARSAGTAASRAEPASRSADQAGDHTAGERSDVDLKPSTVTTTSTSSRGSRAASKAAVRDIEQGPGQSKDPEAAATAAETGTGRPASANGEPQDNRRDPNRASPESADSDGSSASATLTQYQAFHPYMRAWMNLPPPPPPFSKPSRLTRLPTGVSSLTTSELGLNVSSETEKHLNELWKPGTAQAIAQLDKFLHEVFPAFGEERCRRDFRGTSRLSPHVRFGELSPRRMYHAARIRVSRWDQTTASDRLSRVKTRPPGLHGDGSARSGTPPEGAAAHTPKSHPTASSQAGKPADRAEKKAGCEGPVKRQRRHGTGDRTRPREARETTACELGAQAGPDGGGDSAAAGGALTPGASEPTTNEAATHDDRPGHPSGSYRLNGRGTKRKSSATISRSGYAAQLKTEATVAPNSTIQDDDIGTGKKTDHSGWLSNDSPCISSSARAFLKNICLRDFGYHVLFHNPDFDERPLVAEFKQFPWAEDNGTFARWKDGTTGYPMVDAGMRELRQTGWIHNGVRFLLASFLTKYLLLPWQRGLREFYTLLLDGDQSSNALGWQWTSGSNTDAFPFSCLVNPVRVGVRQDPHGHYIRRWIPELRNVPVKYIHQPWKAPKEVLDAAGLTLGGSYPHRVVDPKLARNRARDAMSVMKQIFASLRPLRSLATLDVEKLLREWPDDVEYGTAPGDPAVGVSPLLTESLTKAKDSRTTRLPLIKDSDIGFISDGLRGDTSKSLAAEADDNDMRERDDAVATAVDAFCTQAGNRTTDGARERLVGVDQQISSNGDAHVPAIVDGSKLGLLPSLWSLLQFDEPPSSLPHPSPNIDQLIAVDTACLTENTLVLSEETLEGGNSIAGALMTAHERGAAEAAAAVAEAAAVESSDLQDLIGSSQAAALQHESPPDHLCSRALDPNDQEATVPVAPEKQSEGPDVLGPSTGTSTGRSVLVPGMSAEPNDKTAPVSSTRMSGDGTGFLSSKREGDCSHVNMEQQTQHMEKAALDMNAKTGAATPSSRKVQRTHSSASSDTARESPGSLGFATDTVKTDTVHGGSMPPMGTAEDGHETDGRLGDRTGTLASGPDRASTEGLAGARGGDPVAMQAEAPRDHTNPAPTFVDQTAVQGAALGGVLGMDGTTGSVPYGTQASFNPLYGMPLGTMQFIANHGHLGPTGVDPGSQNIGVHPMGVQSMLPRHVNGYGGMYSFGADPQTFGPSNPLSAPVPGMNASPTAGGYMGFSHGSGMGATNPPLSQHGLPTPPMYYGTPSTTQSGVEQQSTFMAPHQAQQHGMPTADYSSNVDRGAGVGVGTQGIAGLQPHLVQGIDLSARTGVSMLQNAATGLTGADHMPVSSTGPAPRSAQFLGSSLPHQQPMGFTGPPAPRNDAPASRGGSAVPRDGLLDVGQMGMRPAPPQGIPQSILQSGAVVPFPNDPLQTGLGQNPYGVGHHQQHHASPVSRSAPKAGRKSSSRARGSNGGRGRKSGDGGTTNGDDRGTAGCDGAGASHRTSGTAAGGPGGTATSGGKGSGRDGRAADARPPDAPMSLKTRQAVLDEVLRDESHEFYSFAKFLAETYMLTCNTDRQSSKDYIRLCTLKDDFHKECKDERDKLKIYKVKSFFSKVLNLEVTGEWDRHGHGGIRGPWVYGIRPRDAE